MQENLKNCVVYNEQERIQDVLYFFCLTFLLKLVDYDE